MCKFIGVEVIAANALIDIMDNNKNGSAEQASITFEKLHEYGMKIVRFINETYHEGAVILYHNSDTSTNRFINCTDFLECDDTCVRIKQNADIDKLRRRFRATLAYEILMAIYDPKVKKCLF